MQHHPKDMPVVGQQMGSQMSADEMLLRPASQMSINQSFPMDSTMHPAGGSVVSYPHHGHQMQHVMPADPYGTSGNFTDADSQIMERDDPDESDRIEVPRPAGQKANRTAANNELEMRQLYSANRHRDLEEVAKELHGNERGPNSERTRQVFAMLWYVICIIRSQ
jgi:regulatory factor X